MVVKWVEVFGVFVFLDDGVNLFVGYKCVVNILKVEEKKDGVLVSGWLYVDYFKE